MRNVNKQTITINVYIFIMRRKNIAFKALTCGLASLAFTACTDTWESHYQAKPELNATETLWDLIQADEELSEFEAFVKGTGYDEVLSQNRFYTVWAPVNDSEFFVEHAGIDWETLSDSMVNVYKQEFIENHVADYNHTATGTMLKTNKVKMLNGKYNVFCGSGDSYTFKDEPVLATNIAAKNGLLHKVENSAVFTANIWEQLAKETTRLSELYNYLGQFNEIYFDEVNSVQGPMVNGKVTYLDSVVEEYNKWFGYIGQINREDSSYTMFAPTNDAWNEVYEKAKNYFVYAENTPNRDSLQKDITYNFLCHHLVFSNTINKSIDRFNQLDFNNLTDEDSLQSFSYSEYGYSREIFKHEELKRLYANLEETKELSNGTLHIVNSYNYSPFWHDTIRIQGENLYGEAEGMTEKPEYEKATKTYASISKDSVAKYHQTSNGRIGIYTNTTPTGNPVLTFTLKNVLSAKYRIKAVIVPRNFIDWKDTVDLQPNKITAKLYYKDLNGKKKSVEVLKKWETSGDKVDTLIMIPKGAEEGVDWMEFPVNEFALQEGQETEAKLEIKGDVGAREKGFDRVIRIEQVFLEPVIEE